MTDSQSAKNQGKRPGWRCWTGRLFTAFPLGAISYLALAGVGMIPVNRDFREAEDGVEIFVLSSPIHTDIVTPVETEEFNWRELFPDQHFGRHGANATHIAFGWGDRNLYLLTPQWRDLTAPRLLNAVFIPSRSVLHVSRLDKPQTSRTCSRLVISRRQYRELVRHIQSTLPGVSSGPAQPIPDFSYFGSDAFYEARGRYHLFNTCNNWAGRGLRRAGVRIGYWTPLPASVRWTLPAMDSAAGDAAFHSPSSGASGGSPDGLFLLTSRRPG